MLVAGEMRVGDQSTREQMGPLVCIYVTRGDGVISLHRKRGCTDHTSGLWRCDIPDSSGEMQSLYAYIGYERHSNPPGKDTQ